MSEPHWKFDNEGYVCPHCEHAMPDSFRWDSQGQAYCQYCSKPFRYYRYQITEFATEGI